MFQIRFSGFFLVAAFIGIIETGNSIAAGTSPSPKPTISKISEKLNIDPIPSLSSNFLPFQFVPENGKELARFKQITSSLVSDSTHHWEWAKGKLSISYDLMQQLIDRGLPAAKIRVADNVIKQLGKRHGLRFRSSSNGKGLFVPNDEWYSSGPQWALKNTGGKIGPRLGKNGVDIGMEKVWEKFDGSDSLVIAIVDAGYNFDHPELKGRNWINQAEARGLPKIDDDKNGFIDDSLGWDFVEFDNYPDDYHGHGTYCSSVIAAGFDNMQGITGMVPRCRIMPVRVLDASGHGFQEDIALGIRYAINNGADVINFSIGGRDDNEAMRSAFQAANEKGIPIIVAAGNEGIDIDAIPVFPAAYNFENLVVVGSHDYTGQFSEFSNYGKATVAMAAPGEFILVAGIPDAKEIWRDGFESSSLSDWRASGFSLSTVSPLLEKQSLIWNSGNTASLVTGKYLDIKNQVGCVLQFQLNYHPANATDVLILEGNIEGTSQWKEIGFIDSDIRPGQTLLFALKNFDGTRFKLRFRNSVQNSSAGRVLIIDGLSIKAHNQTPPDENIYRVLNGTSVAAAHVTGYVGMQRLACNRMGFKWTRDIALKGVVYEPEMAEKVRTGGRLNVFNGLQFYLSTLPDLQVLDSTALEWHVGDPIHYELDLVPRPYLAYQYSVFGLGNETRVDGAGNVDYTAIQSDIGTRTITVLAEGPTTLRQRFNLTVNPSLPVTLDRAAYANQNSSIRWKFGGRTFLVEGPLKPGRHWIEIKGSDLAGRTQVLKKGWIESTDLDNLGKLNSPLINMAQIEVQLDGKTLAQAFSP